MCAQVIHKLFITVEEADKKALFKKLLVDKFFQFVIEKTDEMLAFVNTKSATNSPAEAEEWLVNELKLRTRSLNVALTMGELFQQGWFQHEILLQVFDIWLSKNKSWETIDNSIKLLNSIGKRLEAVDPLSVQQLIKYLGTIIDGKHKDVGQPTPRMKFMLKDLVDAQQGGWIVESIVPQIEDVQGN